MNESLRFGAIGGAHLAVVALSIDACIQERRVNRVALRDRRAIHNARAFSFPDLVDKTCALFLRIGKLFDREAQFSAIYAGVDHVGVIHA
jgi:hypothetical protein